MVDKVLRFGLKYFLKVDMILVPFMGKVSIGYLPTGKVKTIEIHHRLSFAA